MRADDEGGGRIISVEFQENCMKRGQHVDMS